MNTLNMSELQNLLAQQQKLLQSNEALIGMGQGNDNNMYAPSNLNMFRQSQQQQHNATMHERQTTMNNFDQSQSMEPLHKITRDIFEDAFEFPPEKRQRCVPRQEPVSHHTDDEVDAANVEDLLNKHEVDEPAPVAAAVEGLAFYDDNDVLSGRGGGTNVHPGNRRFRDLINKHRRSYLKARKNDKPAISRAIVRNIREQNGRFLKRNEKANLWYEIGDDAAREKTSQALRQRAPEMRKILFESEMEHSNQHAGEFQRNQHLYYGGTGNMCVPSMPSSSGLGPFVPMPNKNAFVDMPTNDYDQMRQNLMTAALLGGGINRITPHGA